MNNDFEYNYNIFNEKISKIIKLIEDSGYNIDYNMATLKYCYNELLLGNFKSFRDRFTFYFPQNVYEELYKRYKDTNNLEEFTYNLWTNIFLLNYYKYSYIGFKNI